jgi:hypothetical protein
MVGNGKSLGGLLRGGPKGRQDGQEGWEIGGERAVGLHADDRCRDMVTLCDHTCDPEAAPLWFDPAVIHAEEEPLG